jgi:hypothetical protein
MGDKTEDGKMQAVVGQVALFNLTKNGGLKNASRPTGLS